MLGDGFVVSCLAPSVSSAQVDYSFPSLELPPAGVHTDTEADARLRARILEDDAKKNAADAEQLLAMALDLKGEMARGNAQLLSVNANRDTKEIERLARGIRGRMNRNIRDIRFLPPGKGAF